jgi:hypothetical protein
MSLGSASETSSVRFEYKASSAAVWSAIPAATANHPNPDTDFPYAVHWNVLVLDATSYDLRAVATSVSAGTDAFASVVSVVVDHADPDINETSQAGGRIRKQERIHNGVANAVETTDEGTSMSTRVSLPSGSLSESTVTLTIVQNPSTALNPPGDAIDLGLRAEISLSNGQTQLAGGNLATLVFSYPDEDGNGLVDGTAIRADDLKVYVYDLTSGAWQLEFGSTVDTSAKTVSAQTPHFSFFASFAPAFTSLSDVRIYPNPYRPNSGSADDGREFSAGDQNSGIIFDRLPPDFTIDILTISGNRVKTLRPSGGGSRFRWDVLNESGAKTSSGVYFAVISSPDSDTVVRKVAIIR